MAFVKGSDNHPAKMSEMFRRRWHDAANITLPPEVNLWRAVIERAVWDVAGIHFCHENEKITKKQIKQDALAWLRSPSTLPGSCLWALAVVGVNPTNGQQLILEGIRDGKMGRKAKQAKKEERRSAAQSDA